MRLLISLAGAVAVALGLFFLMQTMIRFDMGKQDGIREYRMVDFVRLQREIKVESKERRKPKELPKPKTMPKIPSTAMQSPTPPKPRTSPMRLPELDIPLGLSQNFSLGDAQVEAGGMIDNNVVPLVRVPPRYPMRAKRLRLEGYVKLAFTIDGEGAVGGVEVLESEPEGIFDKAAIEAIKRWKFKPKIENGTAVKQRASQTIEFSLRK